jgi:hypothetical protein
MTACAHSQNQVETPLPRSSYAEYNLEEQLKRNELRDQDAIDFWTRMGEPNYLEETQKSNPTDVGLNFAGYPNIDKVEPDKVTTFYHSDVDVTVTVLSLGLMDDSIRDQEIRVDLHLQGDKWTIEWAGYRQKCRRSLNSGWITNLCP